VSGRLACNVACAGSAICYPAGMKRTLTSFLLVTAVALGSPRIDRELPNRLSAFPIIRPQITPPPNKNGWNNTSVIVHFAVTNCDPRAVQVTPDVVLNSETNNAEVIGVVVDDAGNSNECFSTVNIDKTPPSLVLTAGNGPEFDDSYPLLLIEYNDKGPANPSGIDANSFKAILDDRTVTNLFSRFGNRAIADLKHLPAGQHTWLASIADRAGNVTTISNAFHATGAINSNAPAMTDLNLLDDPTRTPEGGIWVQGKVSGQRSTVAATVNGAEWESMNRRDDFFGRILSMEPETNLILLVASDADGQNRSAKFVKALQSEAFRLELKKPQFGFGRFANGRALPAEGLVSYRFTEGQMKELILANVKVNGMWATTAGPNADGMMTWGGITLPAPGRTNSVMPIVVSLCYTGETAAGDHTNLCMNVPMMFIEAYEIVQKRDSHAAAWVAGVYPANRYEQGEQCATNQWLRGDYGYIAEVESNPLRPESQNTIATFSDSNWPWTWSCRDEEPVTGDGTTDQHVRGRQAERHTAPSRGLSFGGWSWQTKQTRRDTGDGVVFFDGQQVLADGSLTYRTPFEEAGNYINIFTFRGVEGVVLSNLIFEGYSPIVCDSTNGTIAYIFNEDGGAEYTIDRDSFQWPATSTNTFVEHNDPDTSPSATHLEWYSEEIHRFSFSDFSQ
jgi:hypothetical protein